MTLAHLDELLHACSTRFSPTRVALRFNDQAIDWATLIAKTDACAAALAGLGVTPGTCVGWTMPNRPELLYLMLACGRLGACAVPVFHMVPDPVKVGIFSQSRATLVVTTAEQVKALREAATRQDARWRIASVEPSPQADAWLDLDQAPAPGAPKVPIAPAMPLLMASSSGTTGVPKPVMLTQRNVAAVLQASMAMARVGPLDPERGYRQVMAFPLSTSGVLVTAGMLLAGSELIFSHDMSPMTFLGLAERYEAQALSAPPAYFEGILAVPRERAPAAQATCCIMTGMDFLSPSLLTRLCQRFPNVACACNGYGLVETSTIFMLWQAHDRAGLSTPTTRLTLVPGLGNEIDVKDAQGAPAQDGAEGELWVRGPCVVNGYLGGGDEAKAAFTDGWFHTGDVAVREGPDTITLRGRRKYLIKRGGKSVSPVVVKGCLEDVPGVQAAAVVGVPHPMYGEMVWAFVVTAPGATVGLKDLMRHSRAQLASYMVPDQVTFVDAIPRHPGVGKENLDALVARAREELAKLEGEQHESQS